MFKVQNAVDKCLGYKPNVTIVIKVFRNKYKIVIKPNKYKIEEH